jgi:hypothetical protein
LQGVSIISNFSNNFQFEGITNTEKLRITCLLMFFDNYVSIKVFKHIFSAVQCGKSTSGQKSDSVSTRVALATSTGTTSIGKQC